MVDKEALAMVNGDIWYKDEAFIEKETLAQVFHFVYFCEISKNIFSHGTLPVAASGDKSWISWFEAIIETFTKQL